MSIGNEFNISAAEIIATGKDKLQQIPHITSPEHGSLVVRRPRIRQICEGVSTPNRVTSLPGLITFIRTTQVLIENPTFVLFRCSHSNITCLSSVKSRYSFITTDEFWWVSCSSTVLVNNTVKFLSTIKSNPLLSDGALEKYCITMEMCNKICTP